MVRKNFTIVCYDIRTDKRRNKVAALLENYGIRANYSVFECMLTRKQEKTLAMGIRDLIDLGVDTVLFYRVCASCFEKCYTIGVRWEPPEGVVVV